MTKTQVLAIQAIINKIKDSVFQAQYKRSAKNFIRKRKFDFITMIVMFFRGVKLGLQIECEAFFNLLTTHLAADQGKAGSKQAFSKARMNIHPEGLQVLFKEAIKAHYTASQKEGRWNGFRIIACDGSTVRLPSSAELTQLHQTL